MVGLIGRRRLPDGQMEKPGSPGDDPEQRNLIDADVEDGGDDPFAGFSEWASQADDRAYAGL